MLDLQFHPTGKASHLTLRIAVKTEILKRRSMPGFSQMSFHHFISQRLISSFTIMLKDVAYRIHGGGILLYR